MYVQENMHADICRLERVVTLACSICCNSLHSIMFDDVYLPTDPIQAHTVQSTPLNLVDTVDYDGWDSRDGVGAEGSKVKVLNLLPLGCGGTGDTGEGSLTTTLGVA